MEIWFDPDLYKQIVIACPLKSLLQCFFFNVLLSVRSFWSPKCLLHLRQNHEINAFWALNGRAAIFLNIPTPRLLRNPSNFASTTRKPYIRNLTNSENLA